MANGAIFKILVLFCFQRTKKHTTSVNLIDRTKFFISYCGDIYCTSYAHMELQNTILILLESNSLPAIITVSLYYDNLKE